MANAELPRKSAHMQKGGLQVVDLIETKPGQKRVTAIIPLTGRFREI